MIRNTIYSHLFMKNKHSPGGVLSHFETYFNPSKYIERFTLDNKYKGLFYWETGISTLSTGDYTLSTYESSTISSMSVSKIIINSPEKKYKELIIFGKNMYPYERYNESPDPILFYKLTVNNYRIKHIQPDLLKILKLYKQTDCSCCRWI